MDIVCPRVLLTAKELSAVRRLTVASPFGTKTELCFLPWEKLSDVAARASDYFGLRMSNPKVKSVDGKIPKQTTSLVCFVNGDELVLFDEPSK